eukprot:2728110-Pyramimonas_sp.AAC.1
MEHDVPSKTYVYLLPQFLAARNNSWDAFVVKSENDRPTLALWSRVESHRCKTLPWRRTQPLRNAGHE